MGAYHDEEEDPRDAQIEDLARQVRDLQAKLDPNRPSPAEIAAAERVASASTGAEAVSPRSQEEFVRRIQNAQSREEVLEIFQQAGGQVTSSGLAAGQAPLEVVTQSNSQRGR